jgi:hypothetical protein
MTCCSVCAEKIQLRNFAEKVTGNGFIFVLLLCFKLFGRAELATFYANTYIQTLNLTIKTLAYLGRCNFYHSVTLSFTQPLLVKPLGSLGAHRASIKIIFGAFLEHFWSIFGAFLEHF